MSKAGLCCDDCFAMIARKDTRAARLWIDLCTFYVQFGILHFDFSENFPLRNLELLGFITTTETTKTLLVKVQHFHETDEAYHFCGGKCG